jgi:transaldolase
MTVTLNGEYELLDVGATKIFADGADRAGILRLRDHPLVKGFTTNPTLMRQAGVEDYESFALDLVELIPDRPISFEVFADDFDEMERQALKMAAWGGQVYVKIPITNTRGESSGPLQERLRDRGVQLNVTALMTTAQVETVAEHLQGGPRGFVSVFAGRIADTGRDPVPIMTEAMAILADHANLELIWASPREILNVVQAAAIRCDIITVTYDLLNRMKTLGKDLDEFSLETVRMFYEDARTAGYSL